MSEYVATETKNGLRVHRATCKRQGASLPLDQVTPALLATAKAAGCCKPTDWQPTTATVPYTEMAKHFWPQARAGALALAARAGATTTVDNATRTLTLTGTPDQVTRARLAVLGAWAAAPAALAEWKTSHQDVPLQDRQRGYHRFLQEWFARQ